MITDTPKANRNGIYKLHLIKIIVHNRLFPFHSEYTNNEPA